MKTVTMAQFKNELLKDTPVIDVRAAIEFNTGSIPGSVNIPILNDRERHEVGTCYKLKGQAAAIELGHYFVSGENLEHKRKSWIQEISKNENTIITCFRGGLRSQSTQKFLQDVGVETTRLAKGYKSARQYFIEHLQSFSQKKDFVILSGTTGSGKTHVINDVAEKYPVIDLEGLACHRGSAFGALSKTQPAQADFENRLAVQTMKVEAKLSRPLLLEDESRLIGSCHIPEYFFNKMRDSSVVLIEEPLSVRVQNIFNDYILAGMASNTENAQDMHTGDVPKLLLKYQTAVTKIQKKLGGLRAQELLNDLSVAEKDFTENQGLDKNKVWIEKLLVWYYDSMYLNSLNTRNPKILFKGSRSEVTQFFSV